MRATRARVLVSGTVQGVFFRVRTRDTAERLGLSGWVRNLPDGRVEATFQGDRDAVSQAVDFCRQGPEHAHVDDVEVEWAEPADDLAGFDVR
jgi:acylphosphatase